MSAKKDTRDAYRVVKFEEAGSGVYLKLRNSGVAALQGHFDKDHIGIVERGFLLVDVPVIQQLLDLMAWKGDVKFPVKFDDLDDTPVEKIIDKIRDAWCLALNGRTYMEQVEYIRAEAKKLTEDPFLTSPGAGSEPSGGKLSEPA